MKIEFQNFNREEEVLAPQPSSRFIPEWYKTMSNYVNDNKKIPDGEGGTTGTLKTCIPFLDAIMSGYIIPLPCDVFVSIREGEQSFEWRMNNQISIHGHAQANKYPDVAKTGKANAIPKFTNPWGIKTPRGYSCLFITPVHQDLPFRLFEGIVDTDTYTLPVNFPFLMKDQTWEGLISAGTPMAQIIPFKRDTWKMEIVEYNESEARQKRGIHRRKIFDSYKTQFWHKKSYK